MTNAPLRISACAVVAGYNFIKTAQYGMECSIGDHKLKNNLASLQEPKESRFFRFRFGRYGSVLLRVGNSEPYEVSLAKLLHERKERRLCFFPSQLVLFLDSLYNLRNGMLTVAHLPHISSDGI